MTRSNWKKHGPLYLTAVAACLLALQVGCENDCDNGATGSGAAATGGGGSGASGASGGNTGTGGSGGTIPDCEVVLDEDVTADASYDASCVLRIEGEISVKDDATLTFEPGLRVEMAHGAQLWVGDDTPGKLVAQGTDTAGILITSANDTPTPGDWGSVIVTNESLSGTAFEYVTFEYGGAEYVYLDDPAPLYFFAPEHGTPGLYSVDRCTFRNNAGPGVSATNGITEADPGWFASFAGNVFENNGEYSLVLQINMVSSVASDNILDLPIAVWSGVFTDDQPWSSLGVPYVLRGDTSILGTTTIATFNDLTIRLVTGANLRVERAKLYADNTIFESGSPMPTPGDWDGITVITDAQLHMSGCTVRHADGHNNHGEVIWFQGGLALASTIVGTTFSENLGDADIGTQHDHCAQFTSATPPNSFDLTPCLVD